MTQCCSVECLQIIGCQSSQPDSTHLGTIEQQGFVFEYKPYEYSYANQQLSCQQRLLVNHYDVSTDFGLFSTDMLTWHFFSIPLKLVNKRLEFNARLFE